MASMPKSVHHEGKDWYPFSVNFSDPDGRQFSFTIYAVNRKHASYVSKRYARRPLLAISLKTLSDSTTAGIPRAPAIMQKTFLT